MWHRTKAFFAREFFHWQYILATGRLPAFKPVAIVLAAAPLVANAAIVAPLSTPGFWFIWSGSVASIAAFLVTWLGCPAFIRSYEDFESYQKKGHSTRWILWQFYHNFNSHSDLKRVLRESVDKGISCLVSSVRDPSVYGVSPILTAPKQTDATILPPVNANRDLYVPFWLDGKPHVMTIQEDDPKATAKEQELFWIISSRLLSSRPVVRFFNWSLYGITAALFTAALAINMVKPIYGASEPPLSLPARIIKAAFVLLGT